MTQLSWWHHSTHKVKNCNSNSTLESIQVNWVVTQNWKILKLSYIFCCLPTQLYITHSMWNWCRIHAIWGKMPFWWHHSLIIRTTYLNTSSHNLNLIVRGQVINSIQVKRTLDNIKVLYLKAACENWKGKSPLKVSINSETGEVKFMSLWHLYVYFFLVGTISQVPTKF
jgi:hypothetical protein